MSQYITSKSVALVGATVLSGYLLANGLLRIYRGYGSPRILKLIIYPIKSLAGIEVDHFQVTGTGVQYGKFHDRSYILINEHNNMITQRTKPKLSLIKTSVHGEELWLDAPNMQTLKIDINMDTSANAVLDFQVWGQDVKGEDCGKEIDEWFSQFLGAPTRLVRFAAGMKHRSTNLQRDDPVTNQREVVKDPTFPIVYQDGAPCLLINQLSIDDLNSKLDRASQVTYRNFRPNILVRAGQAFAEDLWKDIDFGPVRFRNVKPCTRCTFTTVIPDKGVKHPNGEPLRTLREYRVNHQLRDLYNDTPLFGINLVANNQGKITLGDEINLIES